MAKKGGHILSQLLRDNPWSKPVATDGSMAIEDVRDVLCQQLRWQVPYSEFPELAGNDKGKVRFEFLEQY